MPRRTRRSPRSAVRLRTRHGFRAGVPSTPAPGTHDGASVMAGSGSAHLRGEPMLLRVENLVVEHGAGAERVHAVSDVSFDLRRGETLGLVGESGCGKSTLARAVLQLFRPKAGRVRFDGVDLTQQGGEALRRLRRRMQ